ncbi:hypothetical protein C2857_000705 [Epichloe festucae Fl1]|uniref:Uncharacterized protein n=1 Tax=Epichloe festucae (strain Fl1) TaxID=877507 RepID=A0A7U3SMV7_EPIFF|nr:hypothetical protein C2857_000705 [Epichloe festucae Fl1]
MIRNAIRLDIFLQKSVAPLSSNHQRDYKPEVRPEQKLVEMNFIQRDTLNATAHGITTSRTEYVSQGWKSLFRNAVNLIFRYSKECLRWIACRFHQAIAALLHFLQLIALRIHQALAALLHFLQLIALRIHQALAALWHFILLIALRIHQALAALWHFILLIALRILKWCSIAFAIFIGVQITVYVGYWGMRKLLQIYAEKRKRRLEEIRQAEEGERQAAMIREGHARRAAEADAKLRQARERQARENQQKRDEEQRQIEARERYTKWEQECDSAFYDKASMTQFPFPPLPRCTDPTCQEFDRTPASACQHNFKQFLVGSGKFSLQLLKSQRRLWHEDRFMSCRADLQPEFRRLANSLFVVLDPMYKELNAKQANSSGVE